MAGLCPFEFIRNNRFTNKHYLQTEDVSCNPQNPVNPDSKPSVKTRSIASLRPMNKVQNQKEAIFF